MIKRGEFSKVIKQIKKLEKGSAMAGSDRYYLKYLGVEAIMKV